MNTILIGQAEEIDPVLPHVRKMLGQDGLYWARPPDLPNVGIPMAVLNGKVFCLKVDFEFDPTEFGKDVSFQGPLEFEGGTK
jgi:hypothetical protein